MHSPGQVKISGESCNNKIYYEPDSGDDWDDEDPDEDLGKTEINTFLRLPRKEIFPAV